MKYQPSFFPIVPYVLIKLCEITGKEVRTLRHNYEESGLHQIIWDGKDDKNCYVASGQYLCKIGVNNRFQTIKMILIK